MVKTFSLSPIHETFLWKTTLRPKQSTANDEMRNLAAQIQGCTIPSCKIPAVCWQQRELLKLFLKTSSISFMIIVSHQHCSTAQHLIWSRSFPFFLESCSLQCNFLRDHYSASQGSRIPIFHFQIEDLFQLFKQALTFSSSKAKTNGRTIYNFTIFLLAFL